MPEWILLATAIAAGCAALLWRDLRREDREGHRHDGATGFAETTVDREIRMDPGHRRAAPETDRRTGASWPSLDGGGGD